MVLRARNHDGRQETENAAQAGLDAGSETPSGPPAALQIERVESKTDCHFRNLYASNSNFKQLAKQDADFAAFLKDSGQLDFNDPAAVMQLTKALLKVDFGLRIELPDDRLCPPVPNRHNYILWLKDLMDTTSYEQPGRKLCGLDIGTGASCIYPLLGTAQRPWNFIATDIDVKNLGYARKNVQLNALEDRIQVIERQSDDSLLPLDDADIQSIDFVMTNPPFYVSEDEMLASANEKERPPNSACTGAPVEMVCHGGEVTFVGRLLRESLVLRERVQWYTSMVGKASSLPPLITELRKNNIDNFAVTEFVQGNKTRRWALGWSFSSMRPAQHVAWGINPSLWKQLLPQPVKMDVLVVDAGKPVGGILNKIPEIMGPLELISWVWEVDRAKGRGRARENVWSRAWRRKRLREIADGETADDPMHTDSEECRIGFAIVVKMAIQNTTVSLLWLEGHDYGLFESLGGFVQGRLRDLNCGKAAVAKKSG
ncbi:hypothetical protein B0H63DRAFT_492402 [Podospora didyma]|uniref:Methyltransferase-like protein n=1 Tax=Podospora didyma TaxID=330526 RepID=A0AAE0U3H2_9PEZI|nr:hypothetical protein B0H63DRAFT_492402 [Podospora didyma]